MTTAPGKKKDYSRLKSQLRSRPILWKLRNLDLPKPVMNWLDPIASHANEATGH